MDDQPSLNAPQQLITSDGRYRPTMSWLALGPYHPGDLGRRMGSVDHPTRPSINAHRVAPTHDDTGPPTHDDTGPPTRDDARAFTPMAPVIALSQRLQVLILLDAGQRPRMQTPSRPLRRSSDRTRVRPRYHRRRTRRSWPASLDPPIPLPG